jgi:hypothetical protein
MSKSENPDSEEMLRYVKRTVDALISRLPDDLRHEALKIGYELQRRCRDDDDLLGYYSRSARLITLYAETIREHCVEEGRDFTREIETTYLHELGHHLGLDEAEVERRGL